MKGMKATAKSWIASTIYGCMCSWQTCLMIKMMKIYKWGGGVSRVIDWWRDPHKSFARVSSSQHDSFLGLLMLTFIVCNPSGPWKTPLNMIAVICKLLYIQFQTPSYSVGCAVSATAFSTTAYCSTSCSSTRRCTWCCDSFTRVYLKLNRYVYIINKQSPSLSTTSSIS